MNGAAGSLATGDFEAKLNGTSIHYEVGGRGPVLIAHNGGPGMDARAFGDLAGLRDFATVVLIHPRGSGLSAPAPDGSYRLADYSADLAALIRHLGLERPALLGWSHGGMVAQRFAADHPDLLSRLILVDTAAVLGDSISDLEAAVAAFKGRPWFEASLAALRKEWAGEYSSDTEMSLLWAEEMKFYFHDFDATGEAYHRATKDLVLSTAPLRFFNESEAPTMDLRPLLPAIAVPTLVLVGRHDFICTLAMSEDIVRRIPGARLEVLEESGHFCFVEEAHRFAALLRTFLEA
jgi:proline iminopeptidase